MKKNSKGFTLVELLAVIVVLAVIMVIATTQINGVIKKNRVDSFLSTYKIVLNSAKICAKLAAQSMLKKGLLKNGI